MDQAISFVKDNLTWVLTGGIVALMAFIGYFAEKTNFGQGSVDKKTRRSNPDLEVTEIEEAGVIQSDNSEIVEEEISEVDLSKTEQIDIEQIAKEEKKEPKVEETSDEEDVWKF